METMLFDAIMNSLFAKLRNTNRIDESHVIAMNIEAIEGKLAAYSSQYIEKKQDIVHDALVEEQTTMSNTLAEEQIANRNGFEGDNLSFQTLENTQIAARVNVRNLHRQQLDDLESDYRKSCLNLSFEIERYVELLLELKETWDSHCAFHCNVYQVAYNPKSKFAKDQDKRDELITSLELLAKKFRVIVSKMQ